MGEGEKRKWESDRVSERLISGRNILDGADITLARKMCVKLIIKEAMPTKGHSDGADVYLDDRG